ncbi:hypothetical protein JG687_00018517 [Phytophthora cactorum]|uniref:Uncharacterized protein n=1 Tax=Phytophthora cactorum TaxID=29920 RepID=A0A8T1TPL2_9STRA|nr:hypothetical protein JG687_00018517 [Phytophthora cactorum]
MTPLLTTWCNKLLLARRNFRGSVASAKLNKLDGGAQPCSLRHVPIHLMVCHKIVPHFTRNRFVFAISNVEGFR